MKCECKRNILLTHNVKPNKIKEKIKICKTDKHVLMFLVCKSNVKTLVIYMEKYVTLITIVRKLKN